MVLARHRGEWKCFIEMNGGPYVMIVSTKTPETCSAKPWGMSKLISLLIFTHPLRLAIHWFLEGFVNELVIQGFHLCRNLKINFSVPHLSGKRAILSFDMICHRNWLTGPHPCQDAFIQFLEQILQRGCHQGHTNLQHREYPAWEVPNDFMDWNRLINTSYWLLRTWPVWIEMV